MAQSDIDHIWELMKSISFCMFSNWDGSRLHSRPMSAMIRRDEDAIYFFTDDRAHKHADLQRYPRVCLAFADVHGQKYVSLSGKAELSNDREKIKELWSIPAKAWWNSPDHPDLRLIKVTPEEADYWDAPGNVVSSLRLAFAAATGSSPKGIGEHHRAAL